MPASDSTFDSRGREIEQAEAVDRKVEPARAAMIGLDTLAGASLESPFDGFHIYSCGRSVSGRGARLGPGERSRGLGEPGVADPGRPGRSRARVPRLGPEALPRQLGRHHVAAR